MARRWRRFWRGTLLVVLVLLAIAAAARAVLPSTLVWYVNATIDQSHLYAGRIGGIDVQLWRGAYSIQNVRIMKKSGDAGAPLFVADRIDLAVQWNALRHGKLVGSIHFERPEINFVDGATDAQMQTGVGGPWLTIIRDLFPLRINRATISDGQIHFRAFHTDPPVDLAISHVAATLENLTNIDDDVAPLIATVHARGVALDHARVEYLMKLDPFSYRPTFELGVKLLGLDVTKTNDLAQAYGGLDFEQGWFDLVIEMNAREGRIEGYVKPMYRNVRVVDPQRLLAGDVLEFTWEVMVGTVMRLLSNIPRDQFATNIPFRGGMTDPQIDVLAVIGNILRNAFIRAYLPRFEGEVTDIADLQFEPASIEDVPVLDMPGQTQKENTP